MAETDTSVVRGSAPDEDLEALQRLAVELARKADAATQAYERTVWIKYAGVFFPIPFLVVLFRAHMEAWHYYVAGAMFLAVMMAIYALDFLAAEKVDKAIESARCAHEAYELARGSRRPGSGAAPPESE